MSAKPLIGKGAKLLAYEQDNGSEVVLLAPGGRVLGRYLKTSNQTVGAGGEFIGYGNQLLTLLE
jgi:hypothetical protein